MQLHRRLSRKVIVVTICSRLRFKLRILRIINAAAGKIRENVLFHRNERENVVTK